MARRILFLFVFLVAVTQSASAQSPQATSPSTDAQNKDSKDVRIVLETRTLTLSGDLAERAGMKLAKYPGLGSYAIRDKQQTERTLYAASHDKRSNAGPPQTIIAANGKEREFSPFGRSPLVHGYDVVRATVSDDRQSIQIRLTWAKWKDGSERLPVTTATVPLGSHLQVLATEYISSDALHSGSPWQKASVSPLQAETLGSCSRESETAGILLDLAAHRPSGRERAAARREIARPVPSVCADMLC